MDDNGSIHIHNISAYWTPQLTFQREIGGTVYTVAGSYESSDDFIRKLERINMDKIRGTMEGETEMLRTTKKSQLRIKDFLKKIHLIAKVTSSVTKNILLQYSKENRFPNPAFFVDNGYSGTSYERPGFQKILDESEAEKVAVCITKPPKTWQELSYDGIVYDHYFPEVQRSLYRHQWQL